MTLIQLVEGLKVSIQPNYCSYWFKTEEVRELHIPYYHSTAIVRLYDCDVTATALHSNLINATFLLNYLAYTLRGLFSAISVPLPFFVMLVAAVINKVRGVL